MYETPVYETFVSEISPNEILVYELHFYEGPVGEISHYEIPVHENQTDNAELNFPHLGINL